MTRQFRVVGSFVLTMAASMLLLVEAERHGMSSEAESPGKSESGGDAATARTQPDAVPKVSDPDETPDFPEGGPPQIRRQQGRGIGPGGPMGQELQLVKQFDTDGDARLNKLERQAARAFIKKERPQRGPGGPGPGGRGMPENLLADEVLKALDANKDDKLDKDELLAGVKAFVVAADKDKNNVLSEDEVAESLDRWMPGPRGIRPPGRNPGGRNSKPPDKDRPRGGGFGFGTFLGAALIERADANKDSSVTPEELSAAAERLFQQTKKKKDSWLEKKELSSAIKSLMPSGPNSGRRPFGGARNEEPAKPGPALHPEDVAQVVDAPLYDPAVLRTLFLEFDELDWEAELADFYNTDVEVPATLIVEGKKYENVGVHFRGMSSFFAVGPGHKRSLNISLDFIDEKQRLYGYKTLNLLNAHEDPSFMHTVLYSTIARQYLAAPKANFVKLAINGESWGIYINAQQFDKVFLSESYPSSKGVRWKVPGSPGGRGGLEYLGDDVEEYKRHYEMKSDDGDQAWKDLIDLCRTLSETPQDQLEEKLAPMLDVDGALWFLALENVLINSDGYWIRASDYCLFRDASGKFHVIPHDMNEAFQPAMGPGARSRGGRGSGLDLDPLVGMGDESKPLRSQLLAVPALKARYLDHVRVIANTWLDWNQLGPVVESHRSLIERELEADTRKLSSINEFRESVSGVVGTATDLGRHISLRGFAEQRRKYLLSQTAVKDAQ